MLLVVGCFLPRIETGRSFLEPLERFAYDRRVQLRADETVDPTIVIVAIDEKSIEVEGRWPWSRSRIGDLANALFEHYKIKTLGLDMQFPKETQSMLAKIQGKVQTQNAPQAVTDFIAELERQSNDDAYLAKALNRDAVVLSYAFALMPDGEPFRLGELPAPSHSQTAGAAIAMDTVNSYIGNLKVLQENTRRAGHTRPAVDPDGVIRKVPLYVAFENNFYEAFSVALARAYLGLGHGTLELTETSTKDSVRLVNGVRLGERFIPTDHVGFAAIPFRGRAGSFTTVSATDVLAKRVDLTKLAGKLVIVGVTAQALGDIKTTAIGKEFPGVEIHANLVAGILNPSFLWLHSGTIDRAVFALMVLAIVFAVLAAFLGPLQVTLVFGVILLALFGAERYAWFEIRQVLPLAVPLAALLGIYLVNMGIGFFSETRARRALTNLFGQYVPKDLVNQMSRAPERYRSAIEGENREMTVLFADVRDFTTVSEKLNPKELRDMMNAYLTPITECIHKHHGVIDKYMGDAVMAFWGAPLADANHAAHAVAAARDMQVCMKKLAEAFHARGWPELRIGIGINTGLMSVGDMGSQFRRAFTVLGDAVNVASRIESLTKTYETQILVSQFTVAATPDIAYREVDRVVVKGKTEPITVYAPVEK